MQHNNRNTNQYEYNTDVFVTAILTAVHFRFRIMSHSGKSVSKGDTPSKGGGNYYAHFPKAFLIPYGKTKDDVCNETRLLDMLKPINCEWLKRPDVAALELAETMDEQVSVLHDTMEKVDLQELAEHFVAFADTVANFNTKDKKNKVTKDDVEGLVEALLTPNPEMEAMIVKAEKNKDGLDIAFKKDPSMRSLTKYLLKTMARRQVRTPSVNARRLVERVPVHENGRSCRRARTGKTEDEDSQSYQKR